MILKSFSWKRNIVALVLLAAAAVMVVMQLAQSSFDSLHTLFIRVEHPQSYEFKGLQEILSTYQKGQLIDYRALKAGTLLKSAVAELERINPDKLQTSRLAFWLNTYNLLTLQNIIEHYPIKNLQDLGQSLSLRRFCVGGKYYSLAELEEEIVNPLISEKDPRAIFLLANGALGYPTLLDHVITDQSIDKDLEEATSMFINENKNTYFNPANRTFYISKYFKWHEDILAPKYPNLFKFANSYLPEAQQVDFADPELHLKYFARFNWWLNDTSLAAETK